MKKTKTKKKVKSSAKRICFCLIVSSFLIIVLLVSVFSVVNQIFAKYKEKDELEEKIVLLQEKEDELNSEILKLQDPEYLARYAREKYFYSKENELIIRIPEK